MLQTLNSITFLSSVHHSCCRWRNCRKSL